MWASVLAPPRPTGTTALSTFLGLGTTLEVRSGEVYAQRDSHLCHAVALYALMSLLNRLRHARLQASDLAGSFQALWREGLPVDLRDTL